MEMLPLGGLIRFLRRGSVEKFQHCGSVGRYLCHGSKDNWADSLFGIEHHNDSYTVVVWRSSDTVEAWRGSNPMEVWTIVLIQCCESSTIMIRTLWKYREVPTPWTCGMGHIP